MNEAVRGSAQRSGPGGNDYPSSLQPGGRLRVGLGDAEARLCEPHRPTQSDVAPWRPAYALPDDPRQEQLTLFLSRQAT